MVHALTRFAADKVVREYRLAGAPGSAAGLDASDGSADGPTANAPPYLWREVRPTDIPGVEASDAKQAWVLKRSGTRRARGRVVLLTESGFARCTCPHHEFWGLPCRHVLFLFGPPTLEMCDHLWWQSTVLGKLDDWLWATHYRKRARMPGVLVGGVLVRPTPHQPATVLDTPTVCVTATFLKAEWTPADSETAGPVDTAASTVAPGAVGCSGLAAGVSSKKGYALRQEFIATFCGAWDEAIADGKEEEVEQACNEFIAVLHTMVEGRPSDRGILSDGRSVSMAGAARSRRGPNTSRVNAPFSDPSRGSRNPQEPAKSAKRRLGGSSSSDEADDTAVYTSQARRHTGVRSSRGELQHRDAPPTDRGPYAAWEGSMGDTGG